MGVVEDARFGGLDLSPWGKFDPAYMVVYPLLFHMLDTAAVGFAIWDEALTPSQRGVIADGLGVSLDAARRLVAFFAGCHDLGKLTPCFQSCEAHPWARLSERLRAGAGERLTHGRASMHAAVGLLADLGYKAETNEGPAVRVAQILGAHHGRYLQLDLAGAAGPARVRAALGGPSWEDLRRRYLAQVRHATAAVEVPSRVSVPAAVLITGVQVVADRLASDKQYWLRKAMVPAFGAGEHWAQTRHKEHVRVVEAGLQRVDLEPVPFAQAHGRVKTPNALQTSVLAQLPPAVADRGPGMLVVTDATGGGKSIVAREAVRIFNGACGTSGAAFLLPTTVLTDAVWADTAAWVAAHHPDHAPVTLVHSHSWLNAAYTDDWLAERGQLALDFSAAGDRDWEASDEEAGAGEGRVTVPDRWLRGWDQALLAPFTVATVDQALMAVLPVRFSMLRMLALSGKTVVIDEAHAFSPFTQALLRRLLHWLGGMGCPVVVLSATLPASVTDALVRAYLAGAGHTGRALGEEPFAPPYPGWLFADAARATRTVIAAPPRRAHAEQQRRAVTVKLMPVRHELLGKPGRTVRAGERLAGIVDLVRPVAEGAGCAAVVCATVADAQDTYRYLRRALAGPESLGDDLVLLHARFPGRRREALTARIQAALGPQAGRPQRLVVVTTSMLDLGLDIDVDVMISDLAPLARLLQRVGRLWRFDQAWQSSGHDPRPPWVRAAGPAMTVLHPVDAQGATCLPGHWATLDSAYLLHATAALLKTPNPRTITLPDEVQDLVEQIHGTPTSEALQAWGLEQAWSAHEAAAGAEEHLSAAQFIPPHHRVSSLADQHRQPLTTARAATRLGAMPQRVLPCYRTAAGHLALEGDGRLPLPAGEHLRPAAIRQILERTLPVPAAWVDHLPPDQLPIPDSWLAHPLLADLVLLIHSTAAPDTPVAFGRHLLRLDADLGLLHDET